ncbi:hypothetical protein [Pseudomonas syringae]|uniref:hypothetical protein n=1 Tax=Pseudomonas syringae TaxID=317 RepID=UPI001F2FB8A4|nr:hypothetical protein [Pseudomonas syringae]MCF5371943.1 hypothetical protein [Pseudomonas syringae]MCF5382519.1 hypothetical protein [Pseudomonas syringae]MCF5419406.1 hypothetical protein [Pseudomonas syringae]MCF5451953.1 hypothetical protein [Pseudomonas syringae]MCF5458737.1 hypothetical protein [Pseudomonas syringae]
MRLLVAFAACALAIVSVVSPAQANNKTLVTLIYLDKASMVIPLIDAEGVCRFYGALTQNHAGDFEVMIERKSCPSESGGDVVETIKGAAMIGQFPELPSCVGERDCPRGLPAGSSVTAEF